ncbi:1-deoxy-d-xylulose-5-phosphate synthase, partial [Cystoisospora suis]
LLSSSLSSFLYPFSSSYLSISKPLREHSAAYSSLPIISPSARLPGGGAVITNQSRPHPSFSRSLVSPAFAWRSLNRARSSLFSLSSFCRGRPESLGYLASRELISSCASPCSPLAKEPSLSFLSVSLSTPHFSSLVGSPSVGANRTSTAFEDTLTSCGFTRDAVPGARSFISCRAEGVSALPRPPKRSREEISSKVLSYPTARPVQSEKSETSGHQQGVAFQRMGELSKELRREEGNQSGHSESFRVSNDRMTSKRQLEERGFASLHQRFARRSVPPLLPKPSHSISKHKGLCNLLSAVNLPCDLKRLPLQSLPQLCEEIRQEILRVVSQVGGHLASSLGMVEVIVALLRVLDVPTDRIVYDVSHQAYPHKMLTGRRHLMGSLRRSGGISGFCKRSESIYDAFGAGHSSTSISSIQGMTVAWQVLHEAARGSAKRRLHVAVIGDGGLTGGMAYEALNACGYLRTPVLVLLNDNQQVSLPTGTASAGGTAPASAVSRHMEKLLKARDFLSLKSVSRNGETPVRGTGLLENGDGAESRRRQCEDILDAQEREGEDENGDSHSQVDSSFFEALGFEYLGPVDGHDVENLVAVLSDLKRSGLKGPTVLHVKTEKGHGYPPALEAADRLHGVTPGFSDTLKLVRPPLEASFKKKQCGTNPSLYTPQQRISQSTAALHRLQSGQVSPADSNCRTSGSHQQNQSSTDQTTSSTLEGTPQSTQNLSPHAGLLGGTSLVSSSQKSASSGSVSRPSFTSIAARALLRLAEVDERVVGVTAAMPGGTGLHMMGSKFPRRMFDVGIAEQHAVTFAAGMASEGLKPFCAIYSTFLQRAYDQIVHDAALQKLPVRFLIDRAGYVGPDGSTHHGTFDLAFLGCLPDLVVMAPSDELELLHMVETAYQYEKGPSAVRYPRSSCYGIATLNNFLGHSVTEMPQRGKALEVGKGRIVKKAKPHAKHKVAILSLGTRLLEAVQAAQMLEEGPTGPSSSSVPEDSGGTPSTRVVTLSDDTSISIAPTSHHCKQMSSGWSDSREITSGQGNAGDKRRNACHENEVGVTVADARFLAPLDLELLRQLAADHEALLVVEEGSEGGFGSHVLKALTDEAMLDAGTLKVRSLTMPRRFMEAGTQQQQYEDAGLTAPHFARVIRSLIQS